MDISSTTDQPEAAEGGEPQPDESLRSTGARAAYGMKDVGMSGALNRRSLAKSTAWAVPVLAYGAAAPAFAGSCTPTTLQTTSTVQWVSSQDTFYVVDEGGDPEYHVVRYVFTNNGPDILPAGVPYALTVVITVLDGETATVSVQSTDNASASVTNDFVNDPNTGTNTNTAIVSITPSQVIPVGGTFTVVLLAVYGALMQPVEEQISGQSPATVTDAATCTTYVASSTVSGGSNGTSYTSIP